MKKILKKCLALVLTACLLAVCIPMCLPEGIPAADAAEDTTITPLAGAYAWVLDTDGIDAGEIFFQVFSLEAVNGIDQLLQSGVDYVGTVIAVNFSEYENACGKKAEDAYKQNRVSQEICGGNLLFGGQLGILIHVVHAVQRIADLLLLLLFRKRLWRSFFLFFHLLDGDDGKGENTFFIRSVFI